MKKVYIGAALVAALTFGLDSAAMAQDYGPKSINTGGEKGAYNSTFCPPLPGVLSNAYFQGYQCTPSKGTLDNIGRVLTRPTSIGFVQLDVFAKEMAARPDDAKKLALIRKDIACEGLFMVTKNPDLNNYGDVLGLARRIPFVLPPEASGAAASFAFLQANDPDGLGRARNLRNVADASAMLKDVANGNGGEVGFFVQFADPENANIKFIAENKLKVIPVVSKEIIRAKVGEDSVYEVQTFNLTADGFFKGGQTVTTACTPVAIITGSPAVFSDRNDVDDQKDLISKVRQVPSEKLLPQESRIASLMKGFKKLSGQALEETLAAVDAAKAAVEKRMSN